MKSLPQTNSVRPTYDREGPKIAVKDGTRWLAYVGLMVLTVTAYLPTLRNGFVWNDRDYVTQPQLQSLVGLGRIWWDVGATEQFYPVLHSAFWIEHRLWGNTALPYHLVNACWHALSAIVLVAILRRLRVPGAWLAGALFAVHPVAVESVAWVSEQKNTLSTLFYLLALAAYLHFDECRLKRWYAVATMLFAGALLSKTVTATLPAALLVIFWWRRGTLDWRRDVLPLIPWFLAGAAVGLFSGWVERHYLGADGDDFLLSKVQRLLIAGRALWFYAGNAIWPSHLTFMYPRWSINPGAVWQYAFPVSAVAVLGALWHFRSRYRAPLAVALLFAGALFPTLGFLNVYAFIFSFVADHWEYLALLPAAVAGGAAWGLWYSTAVTTPKNSRVASAIPLGAAVAVIGLFSLLTALQCGMYRNAETLYRETLARNPQAWLAHTNLGVILAERGERQAALQHYQAALAIHPTSPELQNNLGDWFAQDPQGTAEALTHYEEALRLKPTFPEAHNNISGLLLRIPGGHTEALSHAQRAVRLKPDFALAHYNLANALRAEPARQEAAISEYRTAIALDSELIQARNNLGTTLLDAGRTDEAIVVLRQALAVRPGAPELHFNLGHALLAQSDAEAASAEFAAALTINPRYPDASRERAAALLQLGRDNDALGSLREALATDARDAQAHAALGGLLAGRPGAQAEAEAELRTALRYDDHLAVAHYNLANLLRADRHHLGEALEHYRAAVQQAPNFVEARFNLAVTLLSDGDHTSEAVAQLRAVLRLKPDLEPARALLAKLQGASK